ncbi:MAG: DNA polymerase III subunit gamma/tau [bacterium]
MAYLVLARKYRPGSFSEVVGQEHVTRTLKNAIKAGRLGHAFLFSGIRGVGKTSVARILAKALNCEDSSTAEEPCGSCPSCLEVTEGKSLDVIEIDGASHRRIDDIRELRESVLYAPGQDRHKVYIIDEVHMLTTEAFNALLKTLEEPPQRVVFILATTEPHKVPVTIQSRCQRYDFRRIPSLPMAEHLEEICSREGIDISHDSLRRLAIAAEGSLRDSQSLLDQVVSYAGEEVSDDDVNVVLGALDHGMLMRILEAAIGGLPGESLRLAGEMVDKGAEPLRITLDMISLLRALMIIVEVEEPSGVLDMPEGEIEPLKKIAAGINPELLRIQFAVMSRAEERMRRSPQPRFHLELALVHMSRADEIVPVTGQGSPVAGPGLTAGGKAVVEQSPARSADTESPMSTAPVFASIATQEETWDELVSFIVGASPSIGSMLEQLVCVKLGGEELVIGGKKGELYLDILSEKEKVGELEGLFQEFFARKMRVRFKELNDEERLQNHTIVEKKDRQESDLARKIRKETMEHKAVRAAIEIFQGELEGIRVLSQMVGADIKIEAKEEDV